MTFSDMLERQTAFVESSRAAGIDVEVTSFSDGTALTTRTGIYASRHDRALQEGRDAEPAAAPEALHEAINRAWSSIVEDGERLAIDSDGDEDVLDELGTLTDGDLSRANFTLAIVRALGHNVRADRRQGAALLREARDE